MSCSSLLNDSINMSQYLSASLADSSQRDSQGDLGPVGPPNYGDCATFGGKHRLCCPRQRGHRMIDKPSRTSVSLPEKIPKNFPRKRQTAAVRNISNEPCDSVTHA